MISIYLIPLLPAAGSLLNGLFGVRWFSRGSAAAVACASMAGAFALAILAFAKLIALSPSSRVLDVVVGTWIPPIPLETARGIVAFQAAWAFRLDPLAAVMALVVTGIGLLIHVYATAYMQDEPRGAYARFFCYLNLFCAFMLVLVLGSNFLVMFVGWEGVGLCSYLLIGFWYEKKSAADAGKKAFIINRIGDWGFLLGVLTVFFAFGTVDFRVVADAASAMPVESSDFGIVSLICALLFIGAIGKSAQIPLFVWLPDAMEGPTPVSALIHAATMVTAGVYMVARNAVLFTHAPLVMQVVAIVGALTALMAATIGLVQNDIKRVLAYSTVSQLGFMFLATGVGAFAAGIFHLMTHAFFKALLFLGSGSVIHAMAGEQDMQRMGGLRKYMPVTFVAMMVGAFAIAGIPPLSGFFSKDEILFQLFLRNRLLWTVAAVTALLTAFYMARLMALTFYGPYRGPAWTGLASPAAAAEAAIHGARHPHDAHAHGQAQRGDHEVTHGAADVAVGPSAWHGPHEAPRTMAVPVMALAVGAIVAGFVGVPAAVGGANALERFLEPSFTASRNIQSESSAQHQPEPPQHGRAAALSLMLLSTALGIGGIAAARFVYLVRPELARTLKEKWPAAHTLLRNKYYVDELYDATVVRGTLSGARSFCTFDVRVVDGAVDGSGWLTRIAAWVSHMFDKYIVDGAVNFVAWGAGEGSYVLRRLQTGLVQNYALLMVLGVCGLLTIYLIAR